MKNLFFGLMSTKKIITKALSAALIAGTVITSTACPAYALTSQNLPKEGYDDHVVVQSAPIFYDRVWFPNGNLMNGDFIRYSCYRDHAWGVTDDQCLWTKKQIDEIVDSIITPDMNQWERMEKIGEWMRWGVNIRYTDEAKDIGFTKGQSAYEALLYRCAVCAGQSQVQNLLIHRAGLGCGIITSPKANHARVTIPYFNKYHIHGDTDEYGFGVNDYKDKHDWHLDWLYGYMQEGSFYPDYSSSGDTYPYNIESYYYGDPYIDDYLDHKLYDEILY